MVMLQGFIFLITQYARFFFFFVCVLNTCFSLHVYSNQSTVCFVFQSHNSLVYMGASMCNRVHQCVFMRAEVYVCVSEPTSFSGVP